MSRYQQLAYTDELLADDTVHRRYADGRLEWRRRGPGATVTWRDNRGNSGVDEPLGREIVKRTDRDGSVRYGRESGYGRTLWSDGVLTVNRSSFGGRVGGILAAVAGGAVLGALVMPPLSMTFEKEEELREQSAQSNSGGVEAGGDYDDWDDGYGDDDDFG
ncbi:hypothetical protein [Nocardia jinanensis]|uniref:Uncharacterized protein n=1 Tax=Nocardia jinanensis TaxID=382504 RepID=A0A917RTN3_9NOCA|nr:hypothetical protein [Nocardia jinanensis]GGL30821.1 hypothetical protein GCM10011588_51930 [Nocardia jinanensis]